MTPLTHLSSGYLIATFIKKDYYYQSASSKLKTKLILLASILPDLDFFFFKYTKDHHQSLFHVPLFWLSIYLFFIIFIPISKNKKIKNYSKIILITTLLHLFLDWFAARATGLMLFYPLSKKVYSFFPPQSYPQNIIIGQLFNVNPYKYIKFYAQNTILFISELTILVFTLVTFTYKSTKKH